MEEKFIEVDEKTRVRILQVVNVMDRAGIETMLMNYYRYIDKNKVQFDFLTHRPISGEYDEEINLLGGKIFRAPRLYPQNYINYFKYMKKFFEEHKEYCIIHSHIDAMSLFPLMAAKKAGIPIRISQSHSTAIPKDFKYPIKVFCKRYLCKFANKYWACGKEAAKFLFGEKRVSENSIIYVHNSIDTNKFSYNLQDRVKVRRALKINEDEFLVGHVGRFSDVKNHKFLINIFEELIKINTNSRLMLVGIGEKENYIRDLVESKGLSSKVMFMGSRSDISELLQAMDVFVLPSLYEGVPVAAIEAQAAGLVTIVSDTVTSEAGITDLYKQISLKKSANEWAKYILNEVNSYIRIDTSKNIKKGCYDIKQEVRKLESLYLEYMESIKNENCNYRA